MKPNCVYILHKNGADSHYIALKELLSQNGKSIEYREFSVLSKFFKGIFSADIKLVRKQLKNLYFLIGLIFSSNKKIVLGIAPFDSKIIFLLRLLKNHQVYYHTSWTTWDGTFHPKRKNNSEKVMANWKYFLEKKAKHIFCVTTKSKFALLENYDIPSDRINVVYHSLHASFNREIRLKKKNNSFIYAGRMIPQKGIREMLEFFKDNNHLSISLVGEGPEENLAREYSEKFGNISFHGYISNEQKLASIFQEHEYFILNSQRTQKWEELFGMVLIESMAQGVIPVSSDHPGPKEIITEETGYIFEEGKLNSALKTLVQENRDIENKARNCQEHAKKFRSENIADFWRPILN